MRMNIDFSDLGESSAVCGLRGACTRWLDQWVESWRWTNSQHRKIVSLSPPVENLNLKKVIKVSHLNQESRQCFVFFWFLYVSTLWTFLHIRIFHVLIYGYVKSDDNRRRKWTQISAFKSCHHHHHHHVVPVARISLTLSRHFSLSCITSGRSSVLHPVSSHSCCM